MVAAETEKIPTITLTDTCRTKLHEVIDGHPNDVAGLRLQILRRTAEGGLQHVLSMVEEGAQERISDDLVTEVDGITVYVQLRDARYVNGIEIDYLDRGPSESGLEFNNPNPQWFDERELALQQLFDSQINPAIAGHGGMVSLLGVDGEDAYIEFSGGCQGCGQANVTLGQGIETTVKKFVPGIARMVDVTNHEDGTNPYFKPSQPSGGGHSHGHSH
ncbi:MAG: NifU family protein [Chloroflexi bacterium]|nr:NifU family protein [Chloroflexota bacterium]MDA1147903.1 NifU family protein [Chloroflexota bacterium]